MTVDEFALAQRHYPIVFSVGENPIPIALMGLNEGVNVFLDDDGRPTDPDVYIPAYIRRYPFLLARLRPDSDELSLCFDPTVGRGRRFRGRRAAVRRRPAERGDQGDPRNSASSSRPPASAPRAFIEELKKSDLLMDGEVAIQPEGSEQPFIYRGFRMVDEEKLRDLRGDELRKMNQNGMLPLIYAHLFSLSQMRDVFGRQLQQGKAPGRRSQQPAARRR